MVARKENYVADDVGHCYFCYYSSDHTMNIQLVHDDDDVDWDDVFEKMKMMHDYY